MTMMIHTKTVLCYGTQVRLGMPDMYGHQGRELHPEITDEGFIGIVIGNFVVSYGDGDIVGERENMLGGTELECDFDTDHEVVYLVRAPDGRELHLLDHEIEVLNTVQELSQE